MGKIDAKGQEKRVKVPKLSELMYLEQVKYIRKEVQHDLAISLNEPSSFKPCLACQLFVNPSHSEVISLPDSPYVVHDACLKFLDIPTFDYEADDLSFCNLCGKPGTHLSKWIDGKEISYHLCCLFFIKKQALRSKKGAGLKIFTSKTVREAFNGYLKECTICKDYANEELMMRCSRHPCSVFMHPICAVDSRTHFAFSFGPEGAENLVNVHFCHDHRTFQSLKAYL